ncbi:MAG: HAMP domain-containing histidine kinase [Streptococcaceae bacterium]|jgi:signal transduction histidine kinase|nr:HAMP domain-containing histidine kinase [Streptococcaceae bacterium]
MSEKRIIRQPINSWREFSITTRLLLVNITIVLLAFLGVLLVFNNLMSSYISQEASQQISHIASMQTTSSSSLPNLDNAPVGRFNTRSMAFEISNNYAVTQKSSMSGVELQNATTIATALKEGQVGLSSLKNYRLLANHSTFYIETVADGKNAYLLYYTDITGIVNFSNSVNAYLLWITLAVLLFTSLSLLFVTRRITRPLRRLAGFARRIGKGDFKEDESDYHGRELKVLASNLNEAAVQLEQNDQMQKTFFQNASHELRTPLMSIKSYAEGITYDVMAPKDAAATILRETDNMTELVEDLLATSRLDALSPTQADLKNFDLRELMEDVRREQQALADKQGVKFVTDYPKKPVLRRIDYKAMHRAVANIIANALRYATSEVVLTLSASGQLTIANDGPAISETDLPHIFERFYKGNGGVHGIGLAIVKTVIEQHNAHIFVTSDSDWTIFVIDFPEKN